MSYTYLITGATSDVGRALIERLLQNAPADTLVLAQGCGDLEKLADLCARFPGQVRPFDVDLSDRAKVDTFVQVLAASAPAPTHFIHLPALPVVNAKFKAFDQTRFDRDLEIQVHSAVRICRAVLPAMAKARFGRVLFIQTSYTIGCPPKNTAAYVMAKSAIGGLVKSLAVEYARFGVTVNCVAPSMMETNFLKDTPEETTRKVMGMYTDPTRLRATDPGHVEGNPVFTYLDTFDPDTAAVEELKERYRAGKVGDVEVKRYLAGVLNNALAPIRSRREEYIRQPERILSILESGSRRARTIASETLDEAARRMGLRVRFPLRAGNPS